MESTTAGGYIVLAVLVDASAPCRAMETPPLGNNAPFILIRGEISAQIQISSVPARPMRSVSSKYKELKELLLLATLYNGRQISSGSTDFHGAQPRSRND